MKLKGPIKCFESIYRDICTRKETFKLVVPGSAMLYTANVPCSKHVICKSPGSILALVDSFSTVISSRRGRWLGFSLFCSMIKVGVFDIVFLVGDAYRSRIAVVPPQGCGSGDFGAR